MQLSRKLALAFILAMCVLLSVSGFIRVRAGQELFENDLWRDHDLIGYALRASVVSAWSSDGEAKVLAMLKNASPPEALTIRWRTLEDVTKESAREGVTPAQLQRLAAGETANLRDVSGAEPLMSTLVPVTVPDGRRFVIELSESLELERNFLRGSVVNTAGTAVVIMVVFGILATMIGNVFVGGPVSRLVAQARRIGDGDLGARLRVDQTDEIGALAREMNSMADHLSEARERIAKETAARIQARDQLRQADRLLTVGRLASGIAHELGTPLNVVVGRAQMIASAEVTGDEASRCAQIVVDEAERMAAIIRQLLDFARHRRPETVRCDVLDIVGQTFTLLTPMAERAGVKLELERPAEPDAARVEIDAAQMHQVFTNLVVNAIHAMPKGGAVRVRSERLRASVPPQSPVDGAPPPSLRSFIRVTVRDDGSGIAAEHLSRIFEPFFTTKPVGVGTGLGLSVSYGIVQEHGGWIAVESEVGQGTSFHVYLPTPA
jgi:signal transduction histidine kinase